MRARWVVIDGRLVKQQVQSQAEVDKVLEVNHAIRDAPRGIGGHGSKNIRFVTRVPDFLHAQWSFDWRQKGGLAGTGLKCQEYCLLQASGTDYSKLVVTPSGKTPMTARARREQFGYVAEAKKRARQSQTKNRVIWSTRRKAL